ncbi:hypothetical protein ACIRYZ_41510 [Kitasatospora sp. NPDC101155]|uniref:hypothetical protein n=1 Tax=Kitasatospora sp. NPDC101155 TaxID=3364097 RepID=UPI0038000D3A
MVALQVAPEQVGQHLGVIDQGAVVQDCGSLGDVVDEHVADRAIGDRVAVDQLCGGELAAGLGLAQGRWRVLETADGVEDVVGEGQGCHRAAVVATGPGVVGEVPHVEGQQVLAGDDVHAGEHVQGFGRVLVAALSAGAHEPWVPLEPGLTLSRFLFLLLVYETVEATRHGASADHLTPAQLAQLLAPLRRLAGPQQRYLAYYAGDGLLATAWPDHEVEGTWNIRLAARTDDLLAYAEPVPG